MQLVAKACDERIYPVGRLDRNTTGVLLLTNDGELSKKLTHPSHQIAKVYQIELNKPIEEEHFEQIKEGIELEDGLIKVDDIAVIDQTTKGYFVAAVVTEEIETVKRGLARAIKTDLKEQRIELLDLV